ncbi:hypothetical protein JTE90_019960 [Oedothorax gibbosus]|uniref:Uncharacterized protein n=1 Tax=Oedothorax gibbosus TaxID=931172 RepID=A0AAV6TF15_9ARAC|nr:hypothetical protein JTE90_019960 [Oedothorax gibbosus]
MCIIITASTDLPFRFSSNARGATCENLGRNDTPRASSQASTPYIRRRTATTTNPKPVPTFPLRFLVGAFPHYGRKKKNL